MRIRSTKPEFWRSETIASLDWDVRLVLKGVESYVDDNGVGKDNVALICADVFPHDLANDSGTFARVSRALQKLAEANILVRYTFNGERLIYVRRWKSIQRVDKPNDGRFPRPDGTMEYREDVDESVTCDSGVIREGSGSTPEVVANGSEVVAPGTEEQRNRGTEEEQTCATPLRSSDHPRFQEFWDTYPRRLDRRKASKAFVAAVKRADPDLIIAGALRYANDPNREENYTKYAEGWLNGDRWLDEPLPPRDGRRSEPTAFQRKTAQNAAVFEALGETPTNNPELLA